ncbi:DNA-binding transcriptional regulator YdaS (Cro superfamily) [Sphingobium sp. B1D7B]|uniref:helix-turn-helix domain-containing protein n=1 Tax=Sphingobium sp. B1D7B TaxID=2940578 RepID=UPI0039B6D7F1|nr:DNA-binding transcriptional regulator YdaS (Cro superfamily) [Sphingobium sp. B1D7B]
MTLAQYLSASNLKDADFALMIGVDRSTVTRMRNGTQIPTPTVMQAIVEKTSGKVLPNDFYGIAA